MRVNEGKEEREKERKRRERMCERERESEMGDGYHWLSFIIFD